MYEPQREWQQWRGKSENKITKIGQYGTLLISRPENFMFTLETNLVYNNSLSMYLSTLPLCRRRFYCAQDFIHKFHLSPYCEKNFYNSIILWRSFSYLSSQHFE